MTLVNFSWYIANVINSNVLFGNFGASEAAMDFSSNLIFPSSPWDDLYIYRYMKG